MVPLGICVALQQLGYLESWGVWLAILVGHFTRCTLTVARFQQGRWRAIRV
jgi:Na+-driven multidrug efflux pump